MTLFEISERTGISVRNLRKLEKLGVLNVTKDEDFEFIHRLIMLMRKRREMSVSSLLKLYETPDLLEDLKAIQPRLFPRAKAQVRELGDLSRHVPSLAVQSCLLSASRGDADQIAILESWLKEILPAEPVKQSWIAARLLAPMSDANRERNASLIAPALAHVRKGESFAGWWKNEQVTSTRMLTNYFAGPKLALDL